MIFPEIELLIGTHANTATTGRGCFMNVIAYLNGESAITDQSECVCVTVRPIAIWLNDYLRDDERHVLLPFILRALGSATNDVATLRKRALLAADFTKWAAKAAKKAAKKAAAAELTKVAKAAAEAAKKAAEAAEAAQWAAKFRHSLIARTIEFLDAALPPLDDAPSCETQARIEMLLDMHARSTATA